MTRDEARKLLGAYATGSLTEAERTALFQAALEDQDLFDELAGEQALKEILDEPGARQRLVTALEPPRHRAWVWATAAAATLAIMAIVAVVVVSQRTATPPRQIAQVVKSPEPTSSPAAPVPPRVAEPQRVQRKVAPAPTPPPKPPAEVREQLADKLQTDASARGGAVGGFAGARTAAAPRAQNETVTVTTVPAIYFSYDVRADGSLQIAILEKGILSVTASFTKSEVQIFPSAAVAPPTRIRIQIPSDATGVVIGFSKTPGINDAPIQQVAANGFGIDPKPSYGKVRIQPTPLFLKPATR